MILNKDEIRRLITKERLIEGFIDLETQLTENGFDLTVREISKYISYGAVDFDNSHREIPTMIQLPFLFNSLNLPQGVYHLLFNELLNIPLNLCAESIHRSTLMRCGVVVSSGYWESGYVGRGCAFISVMNPYGFTVYKNARVAQIRFHENNPVKKGYSGQYQNEGKK